MVLVEHNCLSVFQIELIGFLRWYPCEFFEYEVAILISFVFNNLPFGDLLLDLHCPNKLRQNIITIDLHCRKMFTAFLVVVSEVVYFQGDLFAALLCEMVQDISQFHMAVRKSKLEFDLTRVKENEAKAIVDFQVVAYFIVVFLVICLQFQIVGG